jgi:uncharacterized membrane-anchored protein
MLSDKHILTKVPQITLAFWAVKIFATTLGETGGDAVSMTMGLGYLDGTALFFAIFLAFVTAQIRAERYHAWLYWAVILATTTAGTTLSDFLDRTANLGYMYGSLLIASVLVMVLVTWRLALGRVGFQQIYGAKVEAFYWTSILVSNTLGTALGDFTASDKSLGFTGGALVFGGLLALIVLAYYFTKVSRALLFWLAFVLTRPLGATLGDTLTKSHAQGGLAFGTLWSSAALALVMVALIVFTSAKSRSAQDG